MSSEANQLPDVQEHGAPVNGQRQVSDRRLYLQLQVYTGVTDLAAVQAVLADSNLDAALYLDASDPFGVGIVFLSEEPDDFVTSIRSLLTAEPFDLLERRPEMTLFGRSYSIGYEPDLNEALVQRPRRTVLNPDWPWAIWYPLRRNGAFARLDGKAQRDILMEHAGIGRAYGNADLAHDIRLACYGMDERDNDFVIGLVGKSLHPLSKVVQDMRKTQQTALYIDSLGPFFVGKKVWATQ